MQYPVSIKTGKLQLCSSQIRKIEIAVRKIDTPQVLPGQIQISQIDFSTFACRPLPLFDQPQHTVSIKASLAQRRVFRVRSLQDC
ncbi:hypothetical protein PDO_5337, partial [Rhizobium sp. PDO1-076]